MAGSSSAEQAACVSGESHRSCSDPACTRTGQRSSGLAPADQHRSWKCLVPPPAHSRAPLWRPRGLMCGRDLLRSAMKARTARAVLSQPTPKELMAAS